MNDDLRRKFLQETETFLSYALAEDIDPRVEYLRIVCGQRPDTDDGTAQFVVHDPKSPPPTLDAFVAFDPTVVPFA